MSSHRYRCIAGALLISVLGMASARPAAAYCRITTCNRERETCALDENGCNANGVPLAWTGGEVAFVVHAAGSELRGISGDALLEAAALAAEAWNGVRCSQAESAHVALRFELAVTLAGASGPSQNLIRFVDAGWPYAAEAVAKATLGMDLDTGEILDADILLNSETYDFAVEADTQRVDLVAVLTHELGHALGLDHSDAPHATMQPETRGFATSELRDLAPDDQAGLCAAYPEKAIEEEVPVSPMPGCSASGRSPAGRGFLPALLLAFGFAVRRLRR